MQRRDLLTLATSSGLLGVASLKEAVAQSRAATLLVLADPGARLGDL